jgi:hypothetical protein
MGDISGIESVESYLIQLALHAEQNDSMFVTPLIINIKHAQTD